MVDPTVALDVCSSAPADAADFNRAGRRADLQCHVQGQLEADRDLLARQFRLFEAGLGDGEVVRARMHVQEQVSAYFVGQCRLPAVG